MLKVREKSSVTTQAGAWGLLATAALALAACQLDDADDLGAEAPAAAAVQQVAGESYPINISTATSLAFWAREEFGQSFRPATAVSIRHVDGCFVAPNIPRQAVLRAGDGMTGPVLASTTQISNTGVPCLVGPSVTYTYVRATFATSVALAGGAPYTAHFSGGGTAPQYQAMFLTWANPYAGGMAMDYYQGAERRYPAYDFLFRIVQAP